MEKIVQELIKINTPTKNSYEITNEINHFVSQTKIVKGLCHLFIQHTSASLIVCENADSTVREDLENFMMNLIKQNNLRFKHTAEGDDDMPAHIRSILTHTDLTIPIINGELALGPWQGVYIWEHRQGMLQRKVIITLIGE